MYRVLNMSSLWLPLNHSYYIISYGDIIFYTFSINKFFLRNTTRAQRKGYQYVHAPSFLISDVKHMHSLE